MFKDFFFQVEQKKTTKQFLFLFVGIIIFSVYAGILLPANDLGTGGALGLAFVLNKFTGINLGTAQLLLNIPLFYIGFRYVGKNFMILTTIVVLSSAFLINYLPLVIHPVDLQDKLVATIFSGILSGISMSFIIIAGGSTGGTDITGKYIVKKFNLNLPTVFLVQDLIIYLIIWFSFDIRYVMYAFIMSFVRNQTMITIQKFLSAYVQCTIICDDTEELVEVINTKMNRGSTIIDVEGGYSHQKRRMIILVIQQNEMHILRKIVNKHCPNAFITTNSINAIMGNFKEHSYRW
ncbi:MULTISPECIES: YitT family protein [unclassified Gemella]|uniref:YitT family protein n=1 Tax=unclassified Gemella TaxID=2624949 RepID=UPI001C03C614|nr:MULTISPECIES: YitT family protein [unclassified Gemella]MBU0278608.1 YitT family protein [Gemella sp. zg-1178]QWQ38268.1 YitT family protein [Gemella sp. zg-570]